VNLWCNRLELFLSSITKLISGYSLPVCLSRLLFVSDIRYVSQRNQSVSQLKPTTSIQEN
jgi:hypothetical protein